MGIGANEVQILVTARDEASKAVSGIGKSFQSLGKVAAIGAAAANKCVLSAAKRYVSIPPFEKPTI